MMRDGWTTFARKTVIWMSNGGFMVKPNEVKANAQKLERDNLSFRSFLKNRADSDKLDAQFLELHKELFANYDCCKCNNCCKTYHIILGYGEVKRIAEFLKITESDFIAEYLTETEENDADEQYEFKSNPCSFLDGDGCCKIQECKPDVCKGFPFTDHPHRLSGMHGIIDHAEVCPVVFEILERLKEIYGFRNRG